MDRVETEPNDNLLDLSAALTTSQKILVQCVRDAIKAHEAEREKHDAALVHELHDVSAEVREIHRLEAEKHKFDLVKLVRNTAAYIVGEIDKRVGK